MKKFVALLMVLSMLMSCTALAAEKTSTQTVAQLYINPQLIAGEEAAQTLIETINSLTFTTTTGDNVVTVAYGANDTEICEYTVATTEEGGLLLFSSLYPNTAVLLDFAKVTALIEQVLPVNVEQLLGQAQSAGNEIMELIMPYAEDINSLLAVMESEVVVDESGMNAYLSVTTQHLAKLLDDWLNRLSADSSMQSVLSVLYTAAMEGNYDAPSFDEFIANLHSQVKGMLSNEAAELGTVGIYQSEDGSITYELTVGNQLLVSMDAYTYEGMDCVDLLVLASSGTDNWQATYEGIYNGTNYNDVMFGVGFAVADNYTYGQIYMIEAGQTLAVTMEETVESAGTDAQKVQTVVSFDMAQGEQSINLGGFAAETVLVDDHTMPSLDDKYVLDVMALPTDMLMNGLPQLGKNLMNGMPELVQLVLDELSELEGLEFLQTITMIETETATEPVEVVTEEATKVDGGIEDM